MKKAFLFLCLVLLSELVMASYKVTDFESGLNGAYVVWNGTCQLADNPVTTDNPSAKALQVNSADNCPVGFPLTLPQGKKLTDYESVKFQVLILSQSTNINWIGFNVGTAQNNNSNNECDPEGGQGPAWETGVYNKWITVRLYFDETKLKANLESYTTGNLNLIVKLGRKEFYYLIDNIELEEKYTPVPVPECGMPFGVNLSGAEFGGVYPGEDGTHYGYPTYKDLNYFNAKGLNLIRFPFRWERVQYTMGGDLVSAEIAKMKTFVDAVEEREMKVILDLHNFGRYSFDGGTTQTVIGSSPSLTKEHLGNLWARLAKEFKDYTCIWGYDIMNEPYSMDASNPWQTIAQAVVDSIRKYDTVTPIIVSGNEFSSSLHWQEYSDGLRNLIDPSDNLIFQAHLYLDKDCSGNYAKSYDEEGVTAQTGVERATPFVSWLKKYNLRGIMGEYGVPDNDTRYLTALENLISYLKQNGVAGTYWSAGPRWGTYPLSVQPTDNYSKDRPQMSVLEKYTCADITTDADAIASETESAIIWAKAGILAVKALKDTSLTVNTLSGTGILNQNIAAGELISVALPKGTYIVCKTKISVE